MRIFQSSYCPTVRKAVHITMAILVSVCIFATGAFAAADCKGNCCMDTPKGHVSGSGLKISGLSHPCCCTGADDDPCQIVETDRFPVFAFAESVARSDDSRTMVDRATRITNDFGSHLAKQAESVPALSMRPPSTPLYLEILALLC